MTGVISTDEASEAFGYMSDYSLGYGIAEGADGQEYARPVREPRHFMSAAHGHLRVATGAHASFSPEAEVLNRPAETEFGVIGLRAKAVTPRDSNSFASDTCLLPEKTSTSFARLAADHPRIRMVLTANIAWDLAVRLSAANTEIMALAS